MDDMVDVRKALEVLDPDGTEKRQDGPWASALDW
jgi:DNA polymerase zeta